MSFTCCVTNEVVIGKSRVLVPLLKRKVQYQKFFERKDRSGKVSNVFVGEPSNGWEVVEEGWTTSDQEEQLKSKYEDDYEPEVKHIYVKVSYKSIPKEKPDNNPYDDYDF